MFKIHFLILKRRDTPHTLPSFSLLLPHDPCITKTLKNLISDFQLGELSVVKATQSMMFATTAQGDTDHCSL